MRLMPSLADTSVWMAMTSSVVAVILGWKPRLVKAPTNRSRKLSITQSYGASSVRSPQDALPADHHQPCAAEALYSLAAMTWLTISAPVRAQSAAVRSGSASLQPGELITQRDITAPFSGPRACRLAPITASCTLRSSLWPDSAGS